MKIYSLGTRLKLFVKSRQSITFRIACLLSILVHVSVFLFATFLVFLFHSNSPNLYIPPLVFDFVFMPSQDFEESEFESKNNQNENPQNSQAQSGNKPLNSKSQVSPSRKRFSRIEKIEMQALTTDENEWLEEEQPNPTYVPAVKSRFNVKQPYYLSALKPSHLLLPRPDLRKPNFVPAKISLSPRQHKILLKKVKKLAAKLHKLDWADSNFVWKDKEQIYDIKVHRQPSRTTTDLDEIVLEVTTQEDGQVLSTEVRMRRLAFSNFAQFVDYWDPHVVAHDDELEGRFHTNTAFAVSNRRGVQPKFHGKVTTAAFEVHSGDYLPFFDQESIFLAGLETGVRAIRLPKNFLPFAIDSTATNPHVHRLTEDAWIVFKRNGIYTWHTASAPGLEHEKTLPDEPFFILGGKKADLHLKGVVKGKVLVYSAGKIIIDDDLLYARHPEISFLADDYLGLVSEKDIEIAHPSVTGPGDLQIFASILAKRRFRVRNLYGHGEATLYIYGSLSAGSLSATEPRYATRVRFDKRLETRRPPHFPMTNLYELIEWDGRWQVKNH